MSVQQQSDYYSNRIKIITLGEFKIIQKNGEVYNTSSRSNRLWSLFKYLLINLNKGITPEILLENISPEADYIDPSNAVNNMIYRLRKLLSNDSIFENRKDIVLFTNGCYMLNLGEDVWIDFIELERSFNIAEALKREDPKQAIEYYLNAFDIYGGELLPELVYENWIFPKRTYYRNLYLKIIANLTKLYAEQKSYEAIVEMCQKAVAIEPYEEEIYASLMENLILMGKIKEAKNYYDKIVSILEKEFGIGSTPELQRIAQMLKTEYVQIKTDSQVMSQILGENDGAFFCDYRDFYTIYVLEKRRCERSGNGLCPVYIEFENGQNVFKSNDYKHAAINAFKDTLINGLRKGDLVCLVNDTRFLVLLDNAEYQIVKMVMGRIIDQFRKQIAFKDIVLEIEACPSLPRPVSK